MFILRLMILLLLSVSATAFAAEIETIGKIKTVLSPAFIVRGSEKIEARLGMGVEKKDSLVTGRDGSMGVVFNDNSTLSLGSGTHFRLSRYELNVQDKKIGFMGRISRGSLIYLSGIIARLNAEGTRFETPVAVAGIKGTRLAILVDGNDSD